MHVCERPKEDPGNLETICELYESKEMGIITVGRADHQKVASMGNLGVDLGRRITKSDFVRGNQIKIQIGM
jgi:hypothetical protein